MRLLFICGRNRLRSPTAEQLFSGIGGVETRSAGLSPDAESPLTAEDIEWADLIFVMEESHRSKLNREFAALLKGKRVVCLGIADDFQFMQSELVDLLWDRVPQSVPVLKGARAN